MVQNCSKCKCTYKFTCIKIHGPKFLSGMIGQLQYFGDKDRGRGGEARDFFILTCPWL